MVQLEVPTMPHEAPETASLRKRSSTVKQQSERLPTEESSNEDAPPFLTDQAREEILALIRNETAKDADEKKPEGNLLPKDTYSFLAFAPVITPAFVMASFTFIIQMFMMAIVIFDQFYWSNGSPTNKLGVPVFIPWVTRVSQALAILISVLMQMDLLWSVNILYIGYDATAVLECLQDQNELSHLKIRWFLSALTRLAVGLLALTAMFMLIMRSDTGKKVLLSFNAVNFIAGLDNAVFVLAKWGYFGTQIKSTSDNPIIGDVDFTKVAKGRGGRCHIFNSYLKHWRVVTVAAIWIVLEGFWLWITLKTINGDYLIQSIYVQYGDDEVSVLGLLSGIYDLKVSSDTVVYVARPSNSESLPGYFSNDMTINQFRFCKPERFWTLEAHAKSDAIGNYSVCNDWFLKSPTVSNNPYNILSVASSKWKVPYPDDGRKGTVQLRSLNMVTRKEECSDGRFGPACEFVEPCESLAIQSNAFNLAVSWSVNGIDTDENGEIQKPFYERLNVDRADAIARYIILKTNQMVLAYTRPVYYAKLPIENEDFIAYEVIVCLGRRWARIIIGMDGTSQALAEKVHLLVEGLKRAGDTIAFRYVTHLSATFDITTLEDTGSPIGLKWYQASDYEALSPNHELQVMDVLRCECPVCPDGVSVMPEANVNAPLQVDFRTSALYGENLTCSDLGEISGTTTTGSFSCTSVQMASIFECGCPFVMLSEPLCPLCADDLNLDDITLDYIPFPGGGGYLGNATCAELAWGSNLRANLQMRDNPNWCPTWQAIYGPLCGCSSPPLPLRCEATCHSDKDVFQRLRLVEYFEPDDSLNGWYCGEILAFMNFVPGDVCAEGWKDALAEACCAAK